MHHTSFSREEEGMLSLCYFNLARVICISLVPKGTDEKITSEGLMRFYDYLMVISRLHGLWYEHNTRKKIRESNMTDTWVGFSYE